MRSCVEPARIALFDRARLAPNCVDAVAATIGIEPVALQEMPDPAEFGVRLVTELAGFEQRDLETRILQKLVNLARRVLAIVAGVDLARSVGGLDIRVEKSGVVALENAGEPAERRDVRCGQHEVSTWL